MFIDAQTTFNNKITIKDKVESFSFIHFKSIIILNTLCYIVLESFLAQIQIKQQDADKTYRLQ